jgi:predicted DNA-binding transcriptional regulator YafY
MPKYPGQKMRLLHVMRYLQAHSDENHTITLKDIVDELHRHGIECDRKSLYVDIEALRQLGMDIVLTKGSHFGYFWANRPFELAEIKLLVDAIQSARFLTAKKSVQLIGKLETLVSSHEAKNLQRQVFIDGRIKAQNESVYYAIDRLHEAIAQKRQVSFKYFEYTLTKTLRYRRNGQVYVVSPYMLHWDGNKYYLVAHYTEHGLTHFRVDKIAEIELMEDPCRASGKMPDLVSYVQQTFSMFGGTSEKVTLRFDNDLIGSVIDRFGTESVIKKVDDQHFSTEVNVTVSPSFFSWVFQFAGKAVVTGPDVVVAQMKQLVEQQCGIYRIGDSQSNTDEGTASDDAFYSKKNQIRLERSMRHAEAGQLTEHELIED